MESGGVARIDGVHGPERKPTIQFIDDWSKLKGALAVLRSPEAQMNSAGEMSSHWDRALADVLRYTPMLMEAYSEAWELMNQMIAAWEKLEESKGSVYVPDAQELISGLANPERTRR